MGKVFKASWERCPKLPPNIGSGTVGRKGKLELGAFSSFDTLASPDTHTSPPPPLSLTFQEGRDHRVALKMGV